MDITRIKACEGTQNICTSGKVNYENNIFYYLIDELNNENIKFCMENKKNDNSIIEIENQELINTLLPMFLNETKEELKKDLDIQ